MILKTYLLHVMQTSLQFQIGNAIYVKLQNYFYKYVICLHRMPGERLGAMHSYIQDMLYISNISIKLVSSTK